RHTRFSRDWSSDVCSSDLQRLSDEKILALTIPEMRAIKAYYASPETAARRTAARLPASPTDVELEVIAQTWSEHCKHKIFAADKIGRASRRESVESQRRHA